MEQKLKLKGTHIGILRHPDGTVEVHRKDNLILNVGFDFIADAIGKGSGRPACMAYTAVGTGTTAAAATRLARRSSRSRRSSMQVKLRVLSRRRASAMRLRAEPSLTA